MLESTHMGGRWLSERHWFSASGLEALMVAYITDLHRFDLTYRHFMAAADAVEATGKDILKPFSSSHLLIGGQVGQRC